MIDLTALIVDDEPLAVRRLEILLNRITGVTAVDSAGGCAEALQKFAAHRPDVILLDICMRDGTGFDILDRLPAGASPTVIFVTAFDDYAVRAFEARAVDYLLKPVETERLQAALNRARRVIEANESVDKLAELRATIEQLRARIRASGPDDDDIWVHEVGGAYARVPLAQIEFARSEGEYVRIHTSERSYLLRISIKQLEEKMRPGEFTRTHRSALVRTNMIQSVRRLQSGGVEVVLREGGSVPAGRVYAKKLRATLIRRRREGPPSQARPV